VTDDDKKVLKKVDNIPTLKPRVLLKEAEGTFIIEKPIEHDDGQYVCTTPSGDSRTFEVSSKS
jgi:hypothetical protein